MAQQRSGTELPWSRATAALLLLAAACLPHSGAENHRVHIAFLTDCTLYSDWQSVAMVFSYKRTRQVRVNRHVCAWHDRAVGQSRQPCGPTASDQHQPLLLNP